MPDFSVDLNYSQEDIFEPIDINEWVMVNNETTSSGTCHATFSTPSAENTYSAQNMELSPGLARELISCSEKFEIHMFDDGNVEIIMKDEKMKNFISKNKNNIRVVL